MPLTTEHILPPLAGAIGIVAYAVLITGLLKTNIQQSFAAYMLWSMLDSIATITTFLEGGNYWLPLSNTVGSFAVTILLIKKKQVSWSWVETGTAALVTICLLIWYAAGEQAGIISSSVAVVIASVPQMVDTYKKPSATPTKAYMIFLIANIVSLIAGKSWSMEERLYAACSVFLCLVIVMFSLRKR